MTNIAILRSRAHLVLVSSRQDEIFPSLRESMYWDKLGSSPSSVRGNANCGEPFNPNSGGRIALNKETQLFKETEIREVVDII